MVLDEADGNRELSEQVPPHRRTDDDIDRTVQSAIGRKTPVLLDVERVLTIAKVAPERRDASGQGGDPRLRIEPR